MKNAESGRFQIHLSTCVLLMLLTGALMSVYFQFSKVLSTMEFLKESSSTNIAMHSSFFAFSLSILIGTAYVLEKMILAPAPAPVRAISHN
jgi:hypothetical protein